MGELLDDPTNDRKIYLAIRRTIGRVGERLDELLEDSKEYWTMIEEFEERLDELLGEGLGDSKNDWTIRRWIGRMLGRSDERLVE